LSLKKLKSQTAFDIEKKAEIIINANNKAERDDKISFSKFGIFNKETPQIINNMGQYLTISEISILKKFKFESNIKIPKNISKLPQKIEIGFIISPHDILFELYER
jgi:hypothetical protein